MSIAVLVYTWRKPGTTKSQFFDYYETRHVPLLHEIVGSDFPTLHRRVYTDANATGALLRGNADQVTYDCMAEILFENEEHFNRFNQTLAPGMSRILEDETQFLDVDKTIAVRSNNVSDSVAKKN